MNIAQILQYVITFWNLAKKYAKAYTDSAIRGIAGGLHWKGSVNYYADLPDNAEEGDCYTVLYKGSSGTLADGTEYAWGDNGTTTTWIPIGPDISYKADKVSGATAGHLAALDNTGNLTDSGKVVSATPVSGGTDAFSTGGAFSELAAKADLVNSKVPVNELPLTVTVANGTLTITYQ